MSSTKTQIILHAGFHKTGTSTIQAFLRENRDALAPHVRILLRRDMPMVVNSARKYSRYRNPLFRWLFRISFRLVLLRIPKHRDASVLISAEELSGYLPGRRGITSYSAAPELVRDMVQMLDGRFGSQLDLTLFYTTRAPASWLRSAHGHLAIWTDITLEEDDFAKKYAEASNLDAVVARISRTVPQHKVESSALEQAADMPLGPADPLITLLGLPASVRSVLTPVRPRNMRLENPDISELLRLNRGNLRGSALKRQKQAYIKRQRNQS